MICAKKLPSASSETVETEHTLRASSRAAMLAVYIIMEALGLFSSQDF